MNLQFMSGLDPQQTQQSQSSQTSQSQLGQSHESAKTLSESNESKTKQSQTELKSSDFSFLGPFSVIFEKIFQFIQRIIMIVKQIILSSIALG